MAKKRSVQADKVRPFAGQPFAFVNHEHEFYPNTVVDLTERDAITGELRYEGSIVYVKSDLTTYQLRGGSANADWVELVSPGGSPSHTTLGDIGTNTHAQIDTHIADASIHFTQASISITESQISNLGSYALTSHDHDSTYLGINAAAESAKGLKTATNVVDVFEAVAPISGQVLTATGADTATWQTPAGGSGGDILQIGTPTDTFVAYFTADKNLSGDAGFTWDDALAILTVSGPAPELRIEDNNNTAATMLAQLAFFDSAGLVAQLGFLSGASGNIVLKNTAGDVVLETSTGTVSVTGAGDISATGYISGYGGTPTDAQVLRWNTTNGRAEFASFSDISATGTPLINQIAVFDTATSIAGAATFTWNGSIFAAGDFSYDSASDKVVIGDGTLSGAGISIDASVTGNPFINLQQFGSTIAVWKFDDTANRTEFSSVADDITFRPGNVDTVTITQALSTFATDVTVTGTVTAAIVQLSGGTGTQGEMSWNTDEETVDLILDGAVLQLGQEMHIHVRNNSGFAINDGDVVMATGTIGASGRITVDLMDGTDPANYKFLLGIATEDIADGTDGKITTFGKVRGIDTTGAPVSETWLEGDVLWVSDTTAGALTNVEPAATEIGMPIAFVIEDHATVGTIMVRITAINEHHFIHVDGGQTINGNLTLTGAFTSPGIDDNATATRIVIEDSGQIVGAVGVDFQIQHAADDRFFVFSGGVSRNDGGNIWMYGGTHSNGGDIVFRTDTHTWMKFDESVGDVSLYTGIGVKTLAVTFDASQLATFAGEVTIQDNFVIEAAIARLDMRETDAALDQGNWRTTANSDSMHSRILDDALTNFYEYMRIERSGTGASVQVDTLTFTAVTSITTNSQLATSASTTTRAGLNVPEGVAPTTPADGDIWITTTDIFARINGVSESLLGGGGGDVTKVGTPVNNQVAVWTGDGTIEGDVLLTWDGTTLEVQNLTTFGPFTSLGFDDNATAIRLTLSNTVLTATVAYETNQYMSVSNAARSALRLKHTGAAVDEKEWEIESIGGQFTVAAVNDARSGSTVCLTIDRTGTTVDSFDVTATTSTFNGALTTTGAFTSLGIDDNASSFRAILADSTISFGDAFTSVFSIIRQSDDATLNISGGDSFSKGANIQLFGSTQASAASDMFFRAGSNTWMQWDESVGDLEILTGIGVKASALTISSIQDCTFASGSVFIDVSAHKVEVGDGTIFAPVVQVKSHSTGRSAITFYQTTTNRALLQYRESAEFWIWTTGDLAFYAGTTRALTIDSATRHATFAEKVIFDASTTADPSFNIPEGVAPTTPVDGDVWVTTTDILARINGVSESLLGGASGPVWTYTLQTGTTYTAVSGDFVVASNTGTVTITLPSGHSVNDTIIVKKTGATGTVTVDGNAAETIDGATTFVLTAQYESITLISDGTNWYIV